MLPCQEHLAQIKISHRTGPFLGSSELELANSPIRVEILAQWLKDYPIIADADLLLKGFTFGFRIPYHGSRCGRISKNHHSASTMPDLILRKLEEEIRLGRVAGPFPEPPLQNLTVSPIGLVPKSVPGEFRLIFDLSFPEGNSVNSGIHPDDATVSYTRFDEITRLVRQEGPGSFLIKVDIKSAFRLLPIHPEDFDLLGMCYQGQFFIDKCLPFGLSVSCALFEKFSTFLEWCLNKVTGSEKFIHYLDDFSACSRTEQGAQVMLDSTLALFAELGVPVAEEKVEGPATCIKFLGLVVDTVKMMVQIPDDKLHDLKNVITHLLQKQGKKITLRELKSLIGKLNFACRAVVPGRAFCRRLIDATCGVRKPYHRIRVTEAMVADLLVWQIFLDKFNGASMIIDLQNEHHLDLFTDAAGGTGFGAYFDGHWVAGAWPEPLQVGPLDITFMELFPIVLSLYLWGHLFSNKKVFFHCDNEAVVTIVNKQSTRSPQSMHLVRHLVSICLSRNIVFKAVHVPGLQNCIADALSRFQFNKFRSLAPQADQDPTLIQPLLWQELMGKFVDC